MKHRYPLSLLFSIVATCMQAQSYCAPTFANGCAVWSNSTITIGAINWSLAGTDCTTSDYTSMSTTVDAGTPVTMDVFSGTWCGCAVWVNLNNDYTFQDAENLYYSYVGGDPGYDYSFPITIPLGTSAGPHRMRVIAPWGSDGFLTTNTNGYGACGAFQYGNFNDFTIEVSGSTGVANVVVPTSTQLIGSPNPTTGPLTLQTSSAEPLTSITARSVDGRLVQQLPFVHASGQVQLDLADLQSGVYVLTCTYRDAVRTMKMIKE